MAAKASWHCHPMDCFTLLVCVARTTPTRPIATRSARSVWAGRELKNIANINKRPEKKIQNVWHATCSPRPPTLSPRHVVWRVWSHPRLNCASWVSSKSVQEVRRYKESKFAHSRYTGIGMAAGFYSVQAVILFPQSFTTHQQTWHLHRPKVTLFKRSRSEKNTHTTDKSLYTDNNSSLTIS